jgi:hypothetical protein
MRGALGGLVAAIVLALPATADAEMTVTLIEVTVADPGACDGRGVGKTSAVRRIGFALGGDDDGQFLVEGDGKPMPGPATTTSGAEEARMHRLRPRPRHREPPLGRT